jgi:hypothetical protein
LLDAASNLPRRRGPKPQQALAAAALAAVLAACGGGEGAELQTVAGAGYTFSAPADWTVAERPRGSSAAPNGDAPEVVSVTVFRLARRYEPDRWAELVPELDRVAAQLATRLGGRVAASDTVTVDGRRARRYDIRYTRDGQELVERTAFVLHERREYQLVCRYRSSEAPAACDTLFATFRLSG